MDGPGLNGPRWARRVVPPGQMWPGQGKRAFCRGTRSGPWRAACAPMHQASVARVAQGPAVGHPTLSQASHRGLPLGRLSSRSFLSTHLLPPSWVPIYPPPPPPTAASPTGSLPPAPIPQPPQSHGCWPASFEPPQVHTNVSWHPSSPWPRLLQEKPGVCPPGWQARLTAGMVQECGGRSQGSTTYDQTLTGRSQRSQMAENRHQDPPGPRGVTTTLGPA